MRFILPSLTGLSIAFASLLAVSVSAAPVDSSKIDQGSPEAVNVYLAQASSSQVINTLNTYIQSNRAYFNSYALRQANQIGESARWESAALQFEPDSGNIFLDLNGYVVLPPGAAMFFGSPPIRLVLLFTPNNCLQYSYTDYGMSGGGLLRGEISAEVAGALNAVRSEMNASLNQEVIQSLSNLGLLGSLPCR